MLHALGARSAAAVAACRRPPPPPPCQAHTPEKARRRAGLQMLEENAKLIAALVENQNVGKLEECSE